MSVARRLERGSRLILASHNSGKLREIAALVAPRGIGLVPAGELGLAEPEETEADFAGNARLKAWAAARNAGLPALADDSGFCVAALGGAPGVLSARWAGPAKDFALALRKVQAARGDNPDDRAWFVCVLCLAWPDGETASYLGRVEGRVVWPPRGALGFGYDPIFVPNGASRTYGEISPDEKQATSHRARAMTQLAAACLPARQYPPGGRGVQKQARPSFLKKRSKKLLLFRGLACVFGLKIRERRRCREKSLYIMIAVFKRTRWLRRWYCRSSSEPTTLPSALRNMNLLRPQQRR